ncbi:MAG: T9SS type A sorting domain-containing protein [Calditrichaeota bacterium]|nr:T9SS type A sorting domain-containing protein [Calditrichota bacterium]
MCISDNAGDDRIDIWQLEARREDWLSLEPMTGEIEAEASQDLTLSIFTEGLLAPDWEAELVFNHNAVGGETILPVTLTIIPDAVDRNNNPSIPDEFGISGIYPNPFNSTTRIVYSVPQTSHINLSLYNLTGRKISTLVNVDQQPGFHNTVLNASNLPTGLYFIRLKASDQVFTQKVMLIR